jgi:hypothetical protein
MGACMSSSNEEAEQKKKSQAIDKILEEDSKRLRKECKILLLGTGETWRRLTRCPMMMMTYSDYRFR